MLFLKFLENVTKPTCRVQVFLLLSHSNYQNHCQSKMALWMQPATGQISSSNLPDGFAVWFVPHLTKHSDDAIFGVSLKDWACRAEFFWWRCTWTLLHNDEHWDLLRFALACSKNAYHARYSTCNSKMSVIYRFNVPRQQMSQTMFSMDPKAWVCVPFSCLRERCWIFLAGESKLAQGISDRTLLNPLGVVDVHSNVLASSDWIGQSMCQASPARLALEGL